VPAERFSIGSSPCEGGGWEGVAAYEYKNHNNKNISDADHIFC